MSRPRRSPRRQLLRGAAAAAGALALAACGGGAHGGSFLRRHYRELSADDKRRLFAALEADAYARTGVRVTIGDPPPVPGVHFAQGLGLTRCIGCRRCVAACARESNCSRDPQIQYIRVLELDRGSFDLGRASAYYDRPAVPAEGKIYLPVSCHQCANPPCVRACPVQATWVEPDGIVVVDYDWCIGCRYCQAACPYWARRFNFAEPTVPPDEITPAQGYLSSRLRPVGVVEKCSFCLHRTRVGSYPACVEACPTGARKFGDLGDPRGELRRTIERKRILVLKEELGTLPRFFYYFD
ncbi:MAG: 4Fe-4S dicluster domain-containing protein [Deltaproteobacteria bacterium]|nr:4Fe-4S dicluster domain-containing protein [Deltaproteobacteria bacterium]